jgi:hypothetical protein
MLHNWEARRNNGDLLAEEGIGSGMRLLKMFDEDRAFISPAVLLIMRFCCKLLWSYFIKELKNYALIMK